MPQVLETSEPLEVERKVEENYLQLLLAPFDQGEAGGVLAVIHDETGRYELDKSRREFVANVSHEMRTPLTSIKGAAETVLRYPDMPADMRESFLSMAVEESDRMTRIVGDLLVLSRLDNNRTKWEISTFSVEAVIQSNAHDTNIRLNALCVQILHNYICNYRIMI